MEEGYLSPILVERDALDSPVFGMSGIPGPHETSLPFSAYSPASRKIYRKFSPSEPSNTQDMVEIFPFIKRTNK
jgi:hypothetical protein